ncbi:MAG: hypothetical protein AAF916_12920 [Planctomycetota bacterium]
MGNNNVYTVLVFSAFLALVFGVFFVWTRLHSLTGSWNPFA